MAVFYLLVINLIAFAMMGIDKCLARKRAWRISEKTLFLPAFLGGGIGGWIGMMYFRHKTKHPKFTVGYPLLATAEMGLLLIIACFALIGLRGR